MDSLCNAPERAAGDASSVAALQRLRQSHVAAIDVCICLDGDMTPRRSIRDFPRDGVLADSRQAVEVGGTLKLARSADALESSCSTEVCLYAIESGIHSIIVRRCADELRHQLVPV